MGHALTAPHNTDGNAHAELLHGAAMDAAERERDKIREDYKGLLALGLRCSPATDAELAELIADDQVALAALLRMVSCDPAEAGLMLSQLKTEYCERVERDMLANASRSVIEDACECRVTDDDFLTAAGKFERFIKEVSK